MTWIHLCTIICVRVMFLITESIILCGDQIFLYCIFLNIQTIGEGVCIFTRWLVACQEGHHVNTVYYHIIN